ncbi:DUF4337 domain-containing protein [Beijerinckia indica]|uniref:Transmembrane protein n=1 Tax=Beijerinckia indica subsp. indica (strain ATCC 9039 / DSM 1715 / NCIMB 8712) TaxID=395963 RepID=B2IK10_BEII9|nr:DUF4337 domain-containing protein [Beijerinckia indica]ACB96385.1 conserved hypothetical protein [Beijerinckia indica subsp. indica ATCC 9039]
MEELPHEHIEHAEHAGHAVQENNRFLITVSGTIAVLAVLAAVIASLETIETGAAIAEKNEAVLKQSQASDQWAFYQAKSIKQNLYDIAASAGSAKSDEYARRAERYEDETAEIKKKADEYEHERDEKLAAGERHEIQHRGLTLAATLVHVGIAVATIAIITRGQRWPWYAAMVLGVAGAVKATWSYLG